MCSNVLSTVRHLTTTTAGTADRRTSHMDHLSPRYGYGNASHGISVQLVSTPAGRRKHLPNCSCPDYFVPFGLARRPLLLNRKEAPARERRRPYVVAFLANRHTVQHPRQEVRRRREGTIGGPGRVERPTEASTRRDSPQGLCKSVRTLCCRAVGVPSRRCCVDLCMSRVGTRLIMRVIGPTHQYQLR